MAHQDGEYLNINPGLKRIGVPMMSGAPGLYQGNGKPAPWLAANLPAVEMATFAAMEEMVAKARDLAAESAADLEKFKG